MSLTYLGPTISDGDLIVPAASEVALDPLLAEAVVLLRASQFTGVDGDDWVNEGTGGAALDAVPTAAAGYTGTFPSGTPGDRISPAFFGPDDDMPQTLRFFSSKTNEGDGANSSQLVTPHTAGMEFTAGCFFTCGSKSIPNATSHGVNQSVRVRVCADATEFTGIDLCVLADTGAIRATGPGMGPVDLAPGAVDPYAYEEFAMSIVVATDLVRGYVRDDADPDVTVGGRGWRIVGESTEASLGDLSSMAGPLIVGIGKGWYGFAEVYEWDGTTATLVANCDPSDAVAWSGPTDTFTSDGTVWTLGSWSAIVDATAAGFQGGPAPSEFAVSDDALLDFLGTGDWTVAAHAAFSQVSPGTFQPLVGKSDGNIGSGGTGWLLTDSSFTGGTVVGAEEGAGPVVSTGGAVTQGTHLLVIRRDGDDWTLFVDGTPDGTPGDLAGMDLTATAALKILNGPARAVFDLPLWNRALTDTEITVDLPAALGI